jgi:hypothetical protein
VLCLYRGNVSTVVTLHSPVKKFPGICGKGISVVTNPQTLQESLAGRIHMSEVAANVLNLLQLSCSRPLYDLMWNNPADNGKDSQKNSREEHLFE